MKNRRFLIVMLILGVGTTACRAARFEERPNPVVVKEIKRMRRGLNTGFELLVANLPPPKVGEDRSAWVLYFDGLPVDGMSPRLPDPTALRDPDCRADCTCFQFEFGHNDGEQAWRDLFARAAFVRQSSLTVGPPTGPVEIKAKKVPFKLLMIPTRRLVIAVICYALVLAAVLLLGWKSRLLQEDNGEGRYSYSLGRSQMAFWFLVILAAYLFMGIMTGRWVGTIGTQALALMGISATTAVAAAVVNSERRGQIKSADKRVKDLQDLQATLQAAINAPANASNVPVLVEQLRTVSNQLAQLAAVKAMAQSAAQTRGFFRDLASDREGIALHRFQVIVWTVVLGFVFVMRVVTDLVMPELDTTTLTLMGISSGTYIGFKFPEKA